MKISDEVKFLEEAFDLLNKVYFESTLQKIAITIQSTPRAHGHFTPWDSWVDGDASIKEINLGAESLKRPVVETVATPLHEMVHYYCHINGIQDTSQGNTYHNKRFKVECEKRGLIIGYDRGIGYSPTTPSSELANLVEQQGWGDRIKLFRDERRKNPTGKKLSSTRKYSCPKCGLSVRATKTVNIACVECGNLRMIEQEK